QFMPVFFRYLYGTCDHSIPDQVPNLWLSHAENAQLFLVQLQIHIIRLVWVLVAASGLQPLKAGQRTQISLLGIAKLSAVKSRKQIVLFDYSASGIILERRYQIGRAHV